MKIISNFKEKWKLKTLRSKIGDILFWSFMLCLLLPQTRAIILAQVNTVKSFVFKPKQLEGEQIILLPDKDFIWKLDNIDGTQTYLNEFNNKVIFINKWATWCPPCVAEMPSIQTLYSKYKDNPNIAFVIVSDENPEKVKQFIKNKGFTFPVYTSEYASPSAFISQSIPATFIVSKSKKLVLKEFGSSDWASGSVDEIIQKLINQ